ncbi:MAG: hypothetical protein HY858_00285 [Candidatus Solibacter usitatus]|nr:hypothetical protein [Candidatus Solibacter usitatus]
MTLLPALSGGTPPKPSAPDYAASARTAHASIGAELLGRAVDAPGPGGGSFYTSSYLVVEVAVFPSGNPGLPVSSSHFRLRLNGASREWAPATPGMAAADIRNPEYSGDHPPGIQVGGGIGGVVIAPRRPAERFPGDPTVRRPGSRTTSDETATYSDRGARAAQELALNEGPGGSARSGLIYFQWKGKLKQLKKIELVYDGPGGKAMLRLR